MNYTVLWIEDGKDKWDRLEAEEVDKLLNELGSRDFPLCDIWIFPPECDDIVITGDRFRKEKEKYGNYTVIWIDESEDRWDRLEYDDVVELLKTLNKPGIALEDIWIFPPQCDDDAMNGGNFNFKD